MGAASNGTTQISTENELLYTRIMKDLINILDAKFEEKLGPIIERKFSTFKSELTKDLEQVLFEKLHLKM